MGWVPALTAAQPDVLLGASRTQQGHTTELKWQLEMLARAFSMLMGEVGHTAGSVLQ